MFRTLIALSFSASLAMAQINGQGGSGAPVPVTPPSINWIAPVGLDNGNFRYQVSGSHFGSTYSGGLCIAHATQYDWFVNSFALSNSFLNKWVVVCDPLAPVVWTDTLVAFDAPGLPAVSPGAPAGLTAPFLVLTTNPVGNQQGVTLSTTFPIPPSVLATSVTYAPSITVHPPTVNQGSLFEGTCNTASTAPVSSPTPAPNPFNGPTLNQ